MSVVRVIIRSCTSRPQLTWLFTYQVSAFSTERTPISAAYPLPRSGTGATGRRRSAYGPSAERRDNVPDATPDRWTSKRTPTSSGFTSETAPSHAGEETCSRCGSLAATTGRGSWRRVGKQCLTSCRHQVSFVSTTKDAPWSRARPSTGRAYSRSTGPGASTLGKSSWNHGNRPSCRNIPGEFARGLFHSDGWRGVNRVRRSLSDGDRWYEYPRYLFGNESTDILRLCGETLDQLGVAWRFSRRNAISVARREAVARLDEFVGPKY